MNQKEIDALNRWEELKNAELEVEKTKNMASQSESIRSSMINNSFENAETALIELQLNIKLLMDDIRYALLGWELKNDNGNIVWKAPEDPRMQIISDFGIRYIMNRLSHYLNINTIMSYYSTEDIINNKVFYIGEEVADFIYNRAEDFFNYPTPEDLYEQFINLNIDLNLNEEELYKRCIEWSNSEFDRVITHYPSIVDDLCNVIHSAYLRALSGAERKSFRERMLLSLSGQYGGNDNNNRMKQFNPLKPSTWSAK